MLPERQHVVNHSGPVVVLGGASETASCRWGSENKREHEWVRWSIGCGFGPWGERDDSSRAAQREGMNQQSIWSSRASTWWAGMACVLVTETCCRTGTLGMLQLCNVWHEHVRALCRYLYAGRKPDA